MESILEVRGVKKHFPVKSKFGSEKTVLKAVDGVDFKLKRGETLGLVGESGSGKSTLARLILRLLNATEGEVIYNGDNIFDYKYKQMLRLRQEMQIVFQDPFASLNPRWTIGSIIAEPLRSAAGRHDVKKDVLELLDIVGLNPDHYNRYPHEFSGGQRQRIGIARAIATKPKLIICDEAVSALDVSIQAQILNLFQDLQAEFNLSYIFIAHDLSVVKHISDRVAVMYLGKIVEIARSETLFDNPGHPYTEALLSAIPLPDPEKEAQRKSILLTGDIPSPINTPSGCPFHTRCPKALNACKEKKVSLKDIGSGHQIACNLYN